MYPHTHSAYEYIIPAHGKECVKTDLSIAIPSGTYGRVAPRSGLAAKHFIDTGAGVIDEDYRGNVMVLLFNHSSVDFKGRLPGEFMRLEREYPPLNLQNVCHAVNKGDRIAQLVLEKIATPEVVEVEDLDATDRGNGGFGSTGIATKQ